MEIHRNNVLHCLSLDWFHMLDRADLENEVRRLEEKKLRYIECWNECTERTTRRIDQINAHLILRGTSLLVPTPP